MFAWYEQGVCEYTSTTNPNISSVWKQSQVNTYGLFRQDIKHPPSPSLIGPNLKSLNEQAPKSFNTAYPHHLTHSKLSSPSPCRCHGALPLTSSTPHTADSTRSSHLNASASSPRPQGKPTTSVAQSTSVSRSCL